MSIDYFFIPLSIISILMLLKILSKKDKKKKSYIR